MSGMFRNHRKMPSSGRLPATLPRHQHPSLQPSIPLTQQGTGWEGAFVKHHECPFSSHWPHFTDKETESRGMLTPGVRGPWDQPQPKQELPPGTNLHTLRGPPSHLFGPEPLPPKPLWPPGRAPACPQLLPRSPQEAEPGETANCTFLGTRPRRPICAPCLRLSFPIREMGITEVVHLL